MKTTPKIVRPLFTALEANNIKAINKVSTQNLSMCINFLGVDTQNVVAMTISIMKDGKKRNSLDPIKFGVTMSHIEQWLKEVGEDYDEDQFPLFYPFRGQLPSKWFTTLECHRVIFIPYDLVWQVIGYLFTKGHLETLLGDKLQEIAVYVNTGEHKCKLKFD